MKQPDLSFVVPAANENRWSDLLAALISTDPEPISDLLGTLVDGVRREVATPSGRGKSDRLDLLLMHEGAGVAAIEVKMLSDLGADQLQRYAESFKGLAAYRVLHLESLPVRLHGAAQWQSLTWESVLASYARSVHPWVRATANAWLDQLQQLVPVVTEATVWNDVPDDPAGMELALRARIAWVSRQLENQPGITHDLMQSTGGGNWAVRVWANRPIEGHLVSAEFQEGMSAYEWKPDPHRAYRNRFRGPSVLLGVRQDVDTSAEFDWQLLQRVFEQHVLHRDDQRAWQQTPAQPKDPVDREGHRAMVAAGGPRWLGKGWGMAAARGNHSFMFGAKYQLPADATMSQIAAELRQLIPLIEAMSNDAPPPTRDAA
ncbi:MAG: PD-(D/E)XK nuclease family protein [Nakamurella sp.]